MRWTRTLPASLLSLGALSYLALSCGGKDDNMMMMMPPKPEGPPTITFDAADLCNAKVPQPTDLFRDALGVDASASCAQPSDPIDAAIKNALADDGVPIDSAITIPLGGEIDAETATSTSAIVMIQRTGTGTTADAFRLVAHTNHLDGTALVVTPAGALDPASYYAVVLSDVLTAKDKPIGQHPAIKALVGNSVIAENTYEGLDATTAARLERERLRLAPIVQMLERATPAIARTQIRSIQGFSTSLGFERMQKVVADYRAAVMAGRFAYHIDAGSDLTPAEVYPPGTPADFFAAVHGFRKGTIRVPKVLDQDGHMRADWAIADESIEVPFLMSLPMGGNYTVAVYTPGFLGSKNDILRIANSMAGAPRAAAFGIDLRCHGDRSLDASGACKDNRTAAEIMALVDLNSNGNMESQAPDGVPDNSGAGFFPGEARALRDTQIASVIELMHVIDTMQRGGTVLTAAGLSVNGGDVHLISHGHSAVVGVMAAALSRQVVRTLLLPSGGTSVRQLIEGAPDDVKDAFDATLPSGVTAQNRSMYLTRLESTVLKAIDHQAGADIAKMRYITGTGGNARILLPHGGIAQHVPMTARQALIDALGLTAAHRVSRHNGNCDAFYLHVCVLGGDSVAWGERAREQLATFISSEGVTVLEPAR